MLVVRGTLDYGGCRSYGYDGCGGVGDSDGGGDSGNGRLLKAITINPCCSLPRLLATQVPIEARFENSPHLLSLDY